MVICIFYPCCTHTPRVQRHTFQTHPWKGMGRADLAQCSTLITPFYSDLTEFQVPGWPSKVWSCLHKCTLRGQSRSSSPQPGQDRCPKCATWNILVPLCVICCRAVPGAEAQCGECWYSQKEHFRLELACSSTEGKKSDLPKLDLKKKKAIYATNWL